MTPSIIASIPVASRLLPSFLDNIIDKKISGVALNIFEQFADWICSKVCWPYITVHQEKLGRVHMFSDGKAKLIDTTKAKVATIVTYAGIDHIALNNKPVCFSSNPEILVHFSDAVYTDFILIKDDDLRRTGFFQIIEQERPRLGNPKPMEKSWTVNLANQVSGGVLVESPV